MKKEKVMIMKVPLLKIKANQIVNDVFIYIPLLHHFIFVDNVDVDVWEENGINYYDIMVFTEYWENENFKEIITRIDPDDDVFIVLNYPLDDKEIIKEVNKTNHILKEQGE